jgi:hemoglobin
MITKTDLADLKDVQLLVDTFYSNVRKDALLAPIFNERIGERWPEHLEKMYKFWQTLLLKEHTYFGSPFPPHMQLPIDSTHFTAWLTLFNKTVDELFAGPIAEDAKWRGAKMAELFAYKLEYSKTAKALH